MWGCAGCAILFYQVATSYQDRNMQRECVIFEHDVGADYKAVIVHNRNTSYINTEPQGGQGLSNACKFGQEKRVPIF